MYEFFNQTQQIARSELLEKHKSMLGFNKVQSVLIL